LSPVRLFPQGQLHRDPREEAKKAGKSRDTPAWSFFTFLRSESVVIEMKPGFLGAVVYLAFRYLAMTINRQWIAREWLYLLGGFVWYFLWPLFMIPLRLVLLIWPNFRFGLSEPLIAFGPYVILQVMRITIWAVRTLREQK
jgi:hypothetical protein